MPSRFLPNLPILICGVIAAMPSLAAEKLSPGPMTFTMHETAGIACQRLATISFPFAEGEMRPRSFLTLDAATGAGTVAQCRVLNCWPDGSARRALLRFLWSPEAKASDTFTVVPGLLEVKHTDLITKAEPYSLVLRSGPRQIRTEGTDIVVARGGQDECRLSFTGLSFPSRFLGPEVAVIENGPCFAWATVTYYTDTWIVCIELQADCLGQIRAIARLRMIRGASTSVPQFGLSVQIPTGGGAQPPLAPSGLLVDGPRVFALHETDIAIPDGPQVRQGRVEVKPDGNGTRFSLTRDTSLDKTVEDQHKQFYEGQERAVEIVLPLGPQHIALWKSLTQQTGLTSTAAPVNGLGCLADIPAVRRCVGVEGLALVSWGKLQRLRELNTERALKLACRDGDEYGDLTSGVNATAPQWTITGLTRIDTGLDMLEDYYRGGDVRLRDLALGWAENWTTLKQYRGWDLNCYGGERYTMTAWQSIPNFGQKGIMMIARAYEETGDPRYRESAIAFADRAVRQMQNRAFFSSASFNPPYAGGDCNIRPWYLGRDLVQMYHWTGNADCLAAAKQVIHRLALTGQFADKPFVPNGLLREGYPDPFSPFDRLVTGTDLGVTEDNSDHLKPFILNYLLEGSQYLYEETKDPVAKTSLIALSDFMLGAMEKGGIWNYAQRHAAEGNSIGHMSVEIANTLLKSHTLTGDRRYKDAAFNAFHLVCKAFDTYGTMIDGVSPPSDRSYFYPGDHCDLDFYRGGVNLQGINRDPTGYLFAAVDRMLRIDPKADEFVLSPPTDPRHKWIIEQVPVSAGPVAHEIGHCYIAHMPIGQDGDMESQGKSNLVLLEDGKPLGPAHSLHRDIRELAGGRYSHWTKEALYFSASDGSDPAVNGRKYAYYFGPPDKIPTADQLKPIPTGGPFAGRKPHPSVELYARGIEAENAKRYKDAIGIWETVLKQWPDSAPELYRQIGLWQKLGDEAQAIATCKLFVATFPKYDRTPSVRMRLAQYALADGNKPEAQQILQDAAKQYAGTPWGEEAAARLWHELGIGQAPATVVHALPGKEPKASPVQLLQAYDGRPSPLSLQVGASYDDANLYLRLNMPLGGPWPEGSLETMRLYLDPRGEMTDYEVFVVDSTGSRSDRPPMWHNRGEGFKPAEGWEGKVTREKDGWTADLTIPFAKIGFKPEPGRRTWRLGFRWDGASGMRLWRPAIPYQIRPQDCGWVAFD